MTQYLPPNLLALFAPRDPLPYIAPLDKLPWEKKLPPYSGVAQFINEFEDPKDTPPPTRVETKEERKERKRKERAEQVAYKLEQDLALWVPGTDPGSTSDPFKTLFIARVNYDTSESKLRREFEVYGPVRKVKLVMNKKSAKPRGYAFVEYEHERDMHSAYKHADGKKLDGRRVLVDVERGRTIKGWRCRRLGGGLGGTRKGGPEVNTKYSGREDNFREDRSRSRSPMARRRRRSRSRSPRRARRSRSRERPPRRRSREREEVPAEARKRNRRSRSRERKRSRSRDRKRSRRSRSPRERKPREKDLERERERKPTAGELAMAANETEQEDPSGESYMVLDPSQIKAEPTKKGYDKYENPEPPEDDYDGNGYNQDQDQDQYNGAEAEEAQEGQEYGYEDA